MASPPPDTSKSKERKRRHHHRSRQGCSSCKQKHMRCDELKPFCRNCLTNGNGCVYVQGGSSPPQSQRLFIAGGSGSSKSPLAAYLKENVESQTSPAMYSESLMVPSRDSTRSVDQSPRTSAIAVEMVDPFNGLPFELGRISNMLLDHFNNYRILLRESVRRPVNGKIFDWAVSDAALLHATLALSAKHWMFLGGQRMMVESTLYQHKTEAIELVNSRLADSVAAIADGTVGAVGVLILVECLGGDREAAQVHLDGLKKMVNIRGDLHSSTMNGILQRVILLADLLTATTNQGRMRFTKAGALRKNRNPEGQSSPRSSTTNPLQDIESSFYTSVGLDTELTKMFMDLSFLSSILASTHRSVEVVDKDTLTGIIIETEKYIDTVMRGGRYGDRMMKGIVAGKAFVVLSGYIYLYLFLKKIEVSSRLYEFMVSLLREDLANVENTMREMCAPELLFWVLFVGASGSVGRSESDWFIKELCVSRDSLGLRSWSEGKEVLEKLAWVEGSTVEFVNERLW